MPELDSKFPEAKAALLEMGLSQKGAQVQSKEGAEDPAQICAQRLLLRFGNL